MAKADPYHALIAMDECSNPKCRLCPACIQLLNDLIRQHLGGHEASYTLAAVALGRKGGQAKSDAKTAAVRENGKKGGYPKGRPRKPQSSTGA